MNHVYLFYFFVLNHTNAFIQTLEIAKPAFGQKSHMCKEKQCKRKRKAYFKEPKPKLVSLSQCRVITHTFKDLITTLKYMWLRWGKCTMIKDAIPLLEFELIGLV